MPSRDLVSSALAGIDHYELPPWSKEDYLASYDGARFVRSMAYVRSYPTELRELSTLLPQVRTPVQLIAGARDLLTPARNAHILHERLPASRLDVLDACHFVWEEAADQYATLVTRWWCGGYTDVPAR
jgi:pimeloyl-ACP methyl ester carboxylesterase